MFKLEFYIELIQCKKILINMSEQYSINCSDILKKELISSQNLFMKNCFEYFQNRLDKTIKLNIKAFIDKRQLKKSLSRDYILKYLFSLIPDENVLKR